MKEGVIKSGKTSLICVKKCWFYVKDDSFALSCILNNMSSIFLKYTFTNELIYILVSIIACIIYIILDTCVQVLDTQYFMSTKYLGTLITTTTSIYMLT